MKFSQTFSMKIQDFLMKNNVEKVWMDSKRWESTQENIPKKINFLRPKKFSKNVEISICKGNPWGIGILKNMENDIKNNVEKVWMDSKRWESIQENIPKKINFLRPKKFSKNFWNFHFIKDFLKDNGLEYIRGGQNPKSGITVKDMRKRTLPGDSSSKSVILIF